MMNKKHVFFQKVVVIAALLAWFVVMLGAFTRLSDAGLGCPDWPGCYGRLVLPKSGEQRALAQQSFPDQPIEARKAWTEMGHRYAAGSLVLLVLLIAAFAWQSRGRVSRILPSFLVLLIGFQAALGMWTVTLKLWPIVVMGHLLGGMLTFASLVYLSWQWSQCCGHGDRLLRRLINVGIIIAITQIALGGWVSANYAGVACVGFPQCNGSWLPTLSFAQGFHLFSPVGANYQGGLLDNEARVTIQMIHRFGAYLTLAYVLCLSIFVMRRSTQRGLTRLAFFAMAIVIGQFSLGIANVLYLLPIHVAVAHNGGAALLLAMLVSMRFFTVSIVKQGKQDE